MSPKKVRTKLPPAGPCWICRDPRSEWHHLQSRRCGGSDLPSNLLELCRRHHSLIHSMGTKTATKEFKLPVDISGIYPIRTDL